MATVRMYEIGSTLQDHAKALAHAVEYGRVGETYNIGGRNERTNLVVVQAICDLLDRLKLSARGSRHRLISLVPDRPGQDRLRYRRVEAQERTPQACCGNVRERPHKNYPTVSGKPSMVAGHSRPWLQGRADRPAELNLLKKPAQRPFGPTTQTCCGGYSKETKLQSILNSAMCNLLTEVNIFR